MSRKRINNNDLLPWFTQDHSTLPACYLASCQKFFDELTAERVRAAMNLKPGEVDDDHSEIRHKQQASKAQAATKCQVTSVNKND